MRISKKDLAKVYRSLNVDFELWKDESDAQPYIKALCDDLENRGIAYISEGALVVDIRQEGDTKELPPCIIRKSDGGNDEHDGRCEKCVYCFCGKWNQCHLHHVITTKTIEINDWNYEKIADKLFEDAYQWRDV